jgi:hypothetical protein
MQNSKKGIQKYHLWLAFFFLIFGGTFSMIVWTVKSAVATPVYDDKSFLSAYHDVDDNFNKMMVQNHRFNTLYDVKVKINERTIAMEIKDAFLGQRSLEKQSANQNMLKVGENSLSVSVTNKKSNEVVSDANVTFQITRAIEDMYDIDLNTFIYDNGAYSTTAKIDLAGNWNVHGTIKVAKEIGYFYIKTHTQK